MPRGGRRRGKPQTAYANRSDLTERKIETPPTVPGQGYGVAKQQQQAQQVAPLAGQGAPVSPARPQPQQGPQMGPPPAPFDRPTERPAEPITAGMPMGPGPGPEALPQAPTQQIDQMGLFLRELYRAQPSEDVHQLIAQHEMKAPLAAPRQVGPPPVGNGAPGAPPQMPTMGGAPTPPPAPPPSPEVPPGG